MIGIATGIARREGASRWPAILRGAAIAAMLATVPVAASAAPARDNAKGEAALAKLLKDRIPGQPVDCISIINTQNSTIIDRTAIVYDNGGTLYVNRPHDADQLNSNDILVTKTSLDQLCNVDVVHLVDRATRMEDGFVGLSEFVPYTRAPKAR